VKRHSLVRSGLVLATALGILVPGAASAQLTTVVYGVQFEGGASEIALAVESAVGAAGLTASRDPMLDSAPGDAILLQYAAAREDSIALVVRARSTPGGIAIEVVVGRSIVLRRYQLAEPAGLALAVRDVARLAIDALVEILADGSERAPGPARAAIVIDDASTRESLQRSLDEAASAGAILVPPAVVSAARAFLPVDGDAGRNTTMLRERLDADRIVLVVPSDAGTTLYVIDAAGTTTRNVAAGAAPSEAAAALASIPAPARRPALRATAIASSARENAVVVASNGNVAPSAGENEHEWLSLTGDDYTWVGAAHLGFAGALSFAERGGVSGGFSISENFPLYAPVNNATFALPLNLFAELAFLFGGGGGGFAGVIPAVILGAGPGIQTKWFWAEVHGGGGFAVSVAAAGGRANANVIGFGNVGFRLGIPFTEHNIVGDRDLISVFSGLDFLIGDGGWFGIASLGITL
jgi:hypothetical protein